MESVIGRINAAQAIIYEKPAEVPVNTLVVDGCNVRMRFADDCTASAMIQVKKTLISAYLDRMAFPGGGGV